MVVSGHTLWGDIATVSLPSGQLTQDIWRFDGPQAQRAFHTRTLLPFGITVIGNEAEGLWTVASQLAPGAGPNADTDTNCTGVPAVIRIDPDSGHQRVVTTLAPGSVGSGFDCEAEDLAENQGVTAGGNLYLLDDVAVAGGGYTRLFRVRL